MNIKKKLVLTVAVVSLAGASFFGVTNTFAQTPDNQGTSLVGRIATKFNLNKADVQAVFDEDREEHQAKMEKRFEDQLTQLVTNGKITEDQKTKIIAKFKEMKEQRNANKDELKNMTQDERKAAHEQKRQELKTWAEANGIDVNVLTGVFGPGKGMGKHMR
jgi:hypothetical protein